MANEKRRDDRPGRAPLGLLAMLVLVALVEGFVSRHALDFTPVESWDWKLNGEAARLKANGRDLLCFGDSLVKLGVLPPVVERQTGRKALNLAVCAAQAPASYFLLRRALESGARPSAVVVDFMPYFLTCDARMPLVAPLWPELLGPRDSLDLAWSRRDAAFFASTMLARALPTVRHRGPIRENLVAALGGKTASRRFEVPLCWRNWRLNGGGMAVPKKPQYRGEFDPKNVVLFPDDWRPDPVNESYLRRFFALAGAHRVPVYWLLTPMVPAVQERREALGMDETYSRFVRRVQAEYPGVVVLDGRRSGYPTSLFWDEVHLDREGSVALSADVAEAVARPPSGGGRWVELPRFRSRAGSPAIEDIEQSRLAVEARSRGALR